MTARQNIESLARLMRVLGAPVRLRLIGLLRERVMCVNALARRLGVSQSAVSQHLRIMRDAGLVRAQKRGYFVHYSLDPDALRRLHRALGELLKPPPQARTEDARPAECRPNYKRKASSKSTKEEHHVRR